jgi:hypothetical protein
MKCQAWLCALIVLCHPGCKHLGPLTIIEDRVAYDEAIAISWKEQPLRLR